MGATHRTDHYDLSQYQGSDKPSYLLDYNSDMAKIDAALYAASTTATEAGDKLHNEVEPTLESTKARSEQNSAELVSVKADVQQNASNITMLTSRVNTIDNKAETLEDSVDALTGRVDSVEANKQNTTLATPVEVDGVLYYTVESAIAAIAQNGGGDMSQYQTKVLVTPITVDGVEYTTVESAMQAINAKAASAGTSDYPDLENKPSINGVTLVGNKSAADLGISGAQPIVDANTPTKVTLEDVGNGRHRYRFNPTRTGWYSFRASITGNTSGGTTGEAYTAKPSLSIGVDSASYSNANTIAGDNGNMTFVIPSSGGTSDSCTLFTPPVYLKEGAYVEVIVYAYSSLAGMTWEVDLYRTDITTG